MKAILRLLLLFLLPIAAFGQSVALTGTVTDTPDAQTWNNGTITFTFFGPQSRSYIWTGGTIPTPITATLSATGTYSVSIPDNSQMTPADSSWTVRICPAVLPAQTGCSIFSKVITSATPVVNFTPASPRFNVPLTPQSVTPISAYADAEIAGGWVGFQYYNLVSQTNRVCQTVTGQTCTLWAAAGGSSTPIALYQFNTANTAYAGGSVGDAKSLNSCTVSIATAAVTCVAANNVGTCSAADTGKIIGSSAGFDAALETKISSCTGATIYNMSRNASGNATLLLTFGTNNTAAFNATMTAALTAFGNTAWGSNIGPTYPVITIPCGRFMTENTANNVAVMRATSTVSGGLVPIQGCGMGGTEVIPANGTVWNTNPGEGTLFASSANVGMTLRDITINAEQINFTGTNLALANFAAGPATDNNYIVENVEVTSWIAGAGVNSVALNTIGICRRCNVHDTSGQIIAMSFGGDVMCEYCYANNIFLGYNLAGVSSARLLFDSIDTCTVSTLGCMDINGPAGNVRTFASDFITPSNGGVALNMNSSTVGATLRMYGNRFIGSGGNGYGLECGNNSGAVANTCILSQTNLIGAGTGSPLLLKNGSTIFDNGNNTYTGGTGIIQVGAGGGIYVPYKSVAGICTGTVTAAGTDGFYGTGSNLVTTACAATLGLGIVMDHAGTAQILQASASAGGVNASSGVVTILKNAAAQTVTCTMGVATSCNDFTHSFTFVAGDRISCQIVTQALDTAANPVCNVALF